MVNFWSRALPSIVSLALAVGLMALLGYGLVQSSSRGRNFAVNTTGRPGQVEVRPAADFSLTLFNGDEINLSQFKGRVVVLNFWASWCPPCRAEAPTLERVWWAYQDKGVTFIGVDIWDGREDAMAFLDEFSVTYPNGLDAGGRIAIEYGVTGIPETYFVDQEGMLVRRWVGPLTEERLMGFIGELLSTR